MTTPTSYNKDGNLFNSQFLNTTTKRVVTAFLVAAAGALGTVLVQSAWPEILHIIAPSPYAYLEGQYSGHWEWTDQNNQNPASTDDAVFFESTADGKLVGRGNDPKLGTYKFSGNLFGNHISASYLSDPGSGQPAQSGGFELSVTKLSPLTLEGTWTGFMDGKRIHGTALLIKHAE